MMRLGLLLLSLLLGLPAWADKPVAPETIEGTTRVDAEQVVELILNTPALVIIDSRRGEEHAKGHIEGAVSLLDAEMTEVSLAMHVPDKNTPVLFYCNGERCMRSANACTKAVQWGYRKVYWFRGGWHEWTEKEMPVAK